MSCVARIEGKRLPNSLVLVRSHALDRFHHVLAALHHGFFHGARVGHGGVVHAQALHGGVQQVEALLRDQGGDRGPHPSTGGGLVEQDELVGALQGLGQGAHVHGLQRRELDQVHLGI